MSTGKETPTPCRAGLGLIVSSSNRVVEPYFRAFAPATLAVHVTRMRMRDRPLSEIAGEAKRAAELLADARVDLIVLQATGVAMGEGPDAEADLMDRVAALTGTPVLSATQAMVQAARALGLGRLVLLTPFDQDINGRESAYLKACGFEVVAASRLAAGEAARSGSLPAERWAEIAAALDSAEADGFFLSGSNTSMAAAVALIERQLGKPAVNSIQATLWVALRRLGGKLGPVSADPRAGRLFGLG